jgi:LysM repeat protein
MSRVTPRPAVDLLSLTRTTGGRRVSSFATYSVQSGDSLAAIAQRFGTTWEVLASINNVANPRLIYPGQVLSIPTNGASEHPGVESHDVLDRVIALGQLETGKPYCGPMVGQPESMRHGNPGWDCSAFVAGMYFKATGGAVQLTAYTDAAYGQTVGVSTPHAGHIVFYRYDDHDPSTSSVFPHMGIWLNDEQTLDCRYPEGVGVHPHLNCPREVRVPPGLAGMTGQPQNGASTRSYTVQPGDFLAKIASQFGTTWQAIAALNHLADPNLIHVGQVLLIP